MFEVNDKESLHFTCMHISRETLLQHHPGIMSEMEYHICGNGKASKQVLDSFMKGEDVAHLKRSFWNGIWSDKSIETTYMKIGKGPAGLIGQTTNFRSLTIWASSHHLWSEVLTELESLRKKDKKDENKHKEGEKGRIKSDMKDRKKLLATLQKCIHPL